MSVIPLPLQYHVYEFLLTILTDEFEAPWNRKQRQSNSISIPSPKLILNLFYDSFLPKTRKKKIKIFYNLSNQRSLLHESDFFWFCFFFFFCLFSLEILTIAVEILQLSIKSLQNSWQIQVIFFDFLSLQQNVASSS